MLPAAANAAAVLMAIRQRAGRPGDMRETMIAGIVIAKFDGGREALQNLEL